MDFSTAVATCMGKYAVFKGRASRSEFWWFYLFTIVLGWLAGIVDEVNDTKYLNLVVDLLFLLPMIGATTRRLHDTNRSGWWQLLFLTIIGGIVVVYWMCLPGEAETNPYGDPVS